MFRSFGPWVLAATCLSGADGLVQFSDGREIVGAVRLDDGVRIHDGEGRAVDAAQIREIRLEPESESMEHHFVMPEAGKTIRREVGEPYPLRHLRAIVRIAGGAEVRGTLATAVAHVVPTGEDLAERVILPSKQSGKPGESLASLVYPTRLVVSADDAPPAALALRIAGAAGEAVALARGSLARVAASPAGDAWTLPLPLQPPAFIAVRAADGSITAAWPEGDDAELRAILAPAVEAAKDFLDDRRLIAVHADGEELYGLLLLHRAGSSTLEGGQRPWRLEVWRWRRDPVDGRMLWAGRGYFFRGNVEDAAHLPQVRREPSWWRQKAGSAYEVGP